MTAGKQIKIIRESMGISQQELADKIKYLNQSQIAKIENGNRKVTATDLVKIASTLGVTVNDLVCGKEADHNGKNRA